jgi:hypothetical protein
MDEQLDFDPDHHAEQLNFMRGSVKAVKNAPDTEYDEYDSDGSDVRLYTHTEDDVSFYTCLY